MRRRRSKNLTLGGKPPRNGRAPILGVFWVVLCQVLFPMKISKQRKWSADPNWTFIFVQKGIFPKKILQKKARFPVLPGDAANSDFFMKKCRCIIFRGVPAMPKKFAIGGTLEKKFAICANLEKKFAILCKFREKVCHLRKFRENISSPQFIV